MICHPRGGMGRQSEKQNENEAETERQKVFGHRPNKFRHGLTNSIQNYAKQETSSTIKPTLETRASIQYGFASFASRESAFAASNACLRYKKNGPIVW